MNAQEIPDAASHGEICEIFPDVFFVTGEMSITGRPMSFSRNMTIIRTGHCLTLINSVKLSEHGLAQLQQLGSD